MSRFDRFEKACIVVMATSAAALVVLFPLLIFTGPGGLR